MIEGSKIKDSEIKDFEIEDSKIKDFGNFKCETPKLKSLN